MASVRSVIAGGIVIGGGAPVSIQSMCNANPRDADAVAAQAWQLHDAGCDLVRIAVPDLGCVPHAIQVRKLTHGIPLIADVHFDHRVAVALCGHVDKIRINPGTLLKPDALRETASALIQSRTPVRIGTNSGSLPEDIRTAFPNTAAALVEAAARTISEFQDLGVNDIVVSVKASSPETTIRACEMAASRFDLPLHIGVTEAGTDTSGAIRSAAVLGSLLGRGIGDTVRVSLAGSPLPEVRTARMILESLGLRRPGSQVRACPTCGRALMDTAPVAKAVEDALERLPRPIRGNAPVIAIMGCVVNGPGEAREADAAIVGTPSGAALYISGSQTFRGTVEETTTRLLTWIQGLQD